MKVLRCYLINVKIVTILDYITAILVVVAINMQWNLPTVAVRNLWKRIKMKNLKFEGWNPLSYVLGILTGALVAFLFVYLMSIVWLFIGLAIGAGLMYFMIWYREKNKSKVYRGEAKGTK